MIETELMLSDLESLEKRLDKKIKIKLKMRKKRILLIIFIII